MNSSKKILLPVAAIAAASIMFALGADEHDGHDHSGHSHAHESEATKKTVSQKASPSGAIIVTEDKQSELGVEVAEAPMRAFGESVGEVTAIPKGSVFREGKKHFVLALSEGRTDSFEKWEVTLGARDDFFVEAQTGVFPGDRVVVAGLDSIRRLEEAAPATEPPVAVAASEEIGTKIESAVDTGVCPLDRRNACEFEPHTTERVPRFRSGRAGTRNCEVIVIEDFYNPHFHGYADFHYHHGYHGW